MIADILSPAETPELRQCWFAEGGAAIRAKYREPFARPATHLIDYERKMEEVRVALLPEPSKPTSLPPAAA